MDWTNNNYGYEDKGYNNSGSDWLKSGTSNYGSGKAMAMNAGIAALSGIGNNARSERNEYGTYDLNYDDSRMNDANRNVEDLSMSAKNDQNIADGINGGVTVGLNAIPVIGQAASAVYGLAGASDKLTGLQLANAGGLVTTATHGDLPGFLDSLSAGVAGKVGLVESNKDAAIRHAREYVDNYRNSLRKLDAHVSSVRGDQINRDKENSKLDSFYGMSSRGNNSEAFQRDYAFGGHLPSNNGDNTIIEAGGTHEMNPMGGVQVGMAGNKPALLEEGEVKAKIGGQDYVFSNRLS